MEVQMNGQQSHEALFNIRDPVDRILTKFQGSQSARKAYAQMAKLRHGCFTVMPRSVGALPTVARCRSYCQVVLEALLVAKTTETRYLSQVYHLLTYITELDVRCWPIDGMLTARN